MNDGSKRRPKDEDLEAVLELIWDGQSLRTACDKLGLHTPSTSTWLHADDKRCEQYVRAREGRAEFLQEEGLSVTKAAALGLPVNGKPVDATGSRAYLDAIKWATARMAPKTAPISRVRLSFEELSDEELDARIAERLHGDSETTDQP